MSEYSRINRLTYWIGIAVIAAVFIALNMISTKQVPVREFVLAAVCIPRLHDIGKSAWWAGGLFLLEIAISVGSIFFLPQSVAMLPIGIFVLVVAGLMVWLGFIPGQPEANRYGGVPARGLSYGKKSDAAA